MNLYLHAIIVFSAMFALDFVWVKYTHATQRHQAGAAAIYAGVILLFNGTVVIGYTEHNWMLVPAILGAVGGTFAAMKIAKKDGIP